MLLLLYGLTRISLLALAHPAGPEGLSSPDTPTYVGPALALLEQGRFTSGPTSTQPEVFRTPGYPLFIAAVYAVLPNSLYSVSAVQIALGGALLLFLWRFLEHRFGRSTAWVGGILWVGAPLLWLLQVLVLSEWLFGILILALALLPTRLLEQRQAPWKLSLGIGLLVAAAAQVKPVLQYLWLPLLPAWGLLLHGIGLPWKRVLGSCLLIVGGALVLIVGWMAHNQSVAGGFTFATVGDSNLMYYRAPVVLARAEGISLEQATQRLEAQLPGHPLTLGERMSAYRSIALNTYRTHPREAFQVTLEAIDCFLFASGGYELTERYGAPIDHQTSPLRDIFSRLPAVYVAHWIHYKTQWLFYWWALLYLMTLYGLLGASLWRSIRQISKGETESQATLKPSAETHEMAWDWRFWLIGAGISGYLLVLSAGPEVGSRFRAPLQPLWIILAAPGVLEVQRWVHAWKARRRSVASI